MNERILELKQQAEAFVDSVDSGLGIEHYRQLVDQKFAELIIKECASLTLDPMQIDEAQYYHGWLDYRDEILEHFGVK